MGSGSDDESGEGDAVDLDLDDTGSTVKLGGLDGCGKLGSGSGPDGLAGLVVGQGAVSVGEVAGELDSQSSAGGAVEVSGQRRVAGVVADLLLDIDASGREFGGVLLADVDLPASGGGEGGNFVAALRVMVDPICGSWCQRRRRPQIRRSRP